MKSFFLILVLLAVLAATLWWAIYAWSSVDVEMSIHGYIAMILGIVFSLVIGCGLMALMFYSSCRYAAKDRWTSGALVHQVCQCRGAFDRTVVLVAIGEDDKATDAVAKSANAADAVFEVVGHIPAATLANWGMTEGEVRLVLPGEPISG